MGKDKDMLTDAGIIIEDPGFLRTWSGYHNLEFLYTLRNKKNKDYLCSVLRKVGLDPALKRPVGKYSLGMRQRLALAQAIMEDPGILILDEPMNGLDKNGVREIRELLLKMKEENKLIILASHNREDIEVLCDEVYEMEGGVISKVKGERHRSKFLQKLAFGSYNKRIADKRTANDWLTKNTEMVDAYNRDKYCTFLFTVNGYQTLFDVLGFIQKKENIEKIPKNLPVYMIAGEEDPVGNYGKGVEKVFEEYRKCGIRDLELKLYEDDRHEILNELDRENVYLDVKNWILKHI